MGRAEERARKRTEDKLERGAENPAPAASGKAPEGVDGDILQTQDETARRIYRTLGRAKRGAKAEPRVSEKPRKWREGRQ